MKETTTKWDFLSTFKPPEELSIESGKIYHSERINEGSPDYDYVSKLFLSTFGGIKNPHPAKPGFEPPGKVSKKIPQPNWAGLGGMLPGGAMPPGAGGRMPTINKVEKIYNCVIYEKFINEFKRMLRKYPQKGINDIMKHLFHGTRQTDPKMIYGSEDGLDIRFSNPGAYGTGVYFANNSLYSSTYAYPVPTGGGREFQMFVCLVLVGDSVQLQGGNYRIPPNKPGSQTERYDSINNGPGGHYIIYDNLKSYPGYLINYTI